MMITMKTQIGYQYSCQYCKMAQSPYKYAKFKININDCKHAMKHDQYFFRPRMDLYQQLDFKSLSFRYVIRKRMRHLIENILRYVQFV